MPKLTLPCNISNLSERDAAVKVMRNFQAIAQHLGGAIGGLSDADREALEHGETAYQGTLVYRSEGVPSNNPQPTGISQVHAPNGTMLLTLEWVYEQGDVPADFLLIFKEWHASEDPGVPEPTDPAIAVKPSEGTSIYTFEGLNPSYKWSFAVASARKTENGLELGPLQSIESWQNVTIGTPNFQGTVDGTPASEVSGATTNFSNRNDRKATVPEDPMFVVDGTAVDHVINDDGSADISLEWLFDGLGDAVDIDGFIVYLRMGNDDTPYVMGTNPHEEQLTYLPGSARAYIWHGVRADGYYTFGVQAYRDVDQDIDITGRIKSAIVQPSLAGENPYQPSSSVEFKGNITGTIDGVPAGEIDDRLGQTEQAAQLIANMLGGHMIMGGGVSFTHTDDSEAGFEQGTLDGVVLTPEGLSLQQIQMSVTDSQCYELTSGTSLQGTVNATAGDMVLATVSIRDSNPLATPQGWTKIYETYVQHPDVGRPPQRLVFLCMRAESTGAVSFTATQTSAGRIYVNLMSLGGVRDIEALPGMTVVRTTGTGAALVPDKGAGEAIIWGCTAVLWSAQAPYGDWITLPDDLVRLSLDQALTQPRLANFIDLGTGAAVNRSFVPGTVGEYIAISAVRLLPAFPPSGVRISPSIDLSAAPTPETSKISWQATTPTGTSVTVETSLSTDGGSTWGAWTEATNGGSIPGITAETNLSSALLKYRVTLESEDSEVTPTVESVTVEITAAGGASIIYIADNADLDLAERVWRWDLNGFGYSTTGKDGPYTTAITADGTIVAALVASGLVTADMIQAGVLQSKTGSTSIDLDNGRVNIQNKVYFDPTKGEYIFDGLLSAKAINALKGEIDVVVSYTTITQVLAAEKGNISELTVDQLDTSDMVQRYLNGDTSNVNFIKIYGQNIEFIEATVKDGAPTAQLLDRKQRPLYWLDAERTGVTTTVTAYPVMVYQYDIENRKKLTIGFEIDPQTGNAIPRMTWGAGDQNDYAKGYILKDETGLRFRYQKASGDWVELALGENGIEGTNAALTSLDIYSDGMISEYDDGTVYDWSWTKDGSGRITEITNNTLSKTATITWNQGAKP